MQYTHYDNTTSTTFSYNDRLRHCTSHMAWLISTLDSHVRVLSACHSSLVSQYSFITTPRDAGSRYTRWNYLFLHNLITPWLYRYLLNLLVCLTLYELRHAECQHVGLSLSLYTGSLLWRYIKHTRNIHRSILSNIILSFAIAFLFSHYTRFCCCC